ncbi:MAG: tRNA 5-methoxyuridine(34)/uridine 5-oxyacetic acid(34) synthase CmoB [Gammaproteobacteria bacterium]|nr:MAG: tRNA 5-methoxyuridine(34)/uridine 5-oxyacetic acid(34) synthase CmoB [Gammaproteobacteria bacterium]
MPFEAVARAGFPRLAQACAEGLAARLHPSRHGDLPRWQAAVAALPDLPPGPLRVQAGAVAAGCPDPPPAPAAQARLRSALMQLHPWRKGPFELPGVRIDAEWRSDLKWARLAPHVDFQGRRVLDVGCGNGYYAWRMQLAGAALVVGIDPSLRFHHQYLAFRKYVAGEVRALVLPWALEDFPRTGETFDVVLSMGVLYHRRSPFDHLLQLRERLAPGGTLVLETLVIEGGPGRVLVPRERYARMRNVWFLPSVPELEHWLARCGYRDARTVDVSVTTPREQRSTEWMRFESLDRCLDPADPTRTVEGLPAPRRALVLARR